MGGRMAEELSRPPKEKTGNFDLRFVSSVALKIS